MKKKFSWRTLSFSSEPEILDGEVVTTVDQHMRYLMSGTLSVSKSDALAVPAVLRGRNLICNIATLPLITLRGDNEVVANEFLRQIDPSVPNLKILADTIEDLLFYAKAYWYVDEVDYRDYPLRAHHVPYNEVYEDPQGNVWIEGKRVDVNRVIDFVSPNPGLLKTIASTINRAIATAKTSENYARNPMPKLLFSPKDNVDPGDAEQRRKALQEFADTAAESPYNYVGAALDAKPLEWLSPADLQLVDIEKNIERAVANALGIDPEDLGISTTSRTYQNAVDRRKDRVNDLLNVYMLAITSRLSMGDVTPRGYYVRFDQDDYLRADPKTRMEVYTGYLAAGVLTVDEIRSKEGLPAMTAEQKASIAPKRQESFADEADMNLDFEGAGFSAESVNTRSRTVEALVVPYGQAAKSNGRRWQFEKGSLYWNDLKRVKLLRDHDNAQAVGYAIHAEDTDKGLVVTFKVAPGEAGDRALNDFLAGTHDGVSIGVDFQQSDYTTDPASPGVNFVKKAHLREVSQTAMPAFDDSRAITVTASRNGVEMTEQSTNDAVDVSKLVADAVAAAFAANETKKPASVQEDPTVAPKQSKTSETVTFVNEPSPYRWGDPDAEYDFSRDLIGTLKGKADGSAHKRLNGWVSETFAVATSNTASAFPEIQKPGMFVDLKDYRYPIWAAVYKGAPDNGVQPFAFPKYSSSSNLVQNHSEGDAEPTLGSYALTKQTVQPDGYAGKVEINREVWDMGGDPNVSTLIRNQMVRDLYEKLEKDTYAFLETLTVTEITLPTAGTDAAVDDAVAAALADLWFERGGNTMTDLFLHKSLFKKLLLAKDTTGRRLYPRLGPTNAAGTVTSRLSSLDVNGIVGVPAWGAGTTEDANNHNSYLLDRETVWAWATQPEFKVFDIQLKSVFLGLWGYKAFANSDATGVRRIKYDTTA